MAPASTFTPKASLTDAPTNLKEAIDWVLRVTGKDGNALNKDKGECICGLAAAVTDLLQSVELQYHGYEGDSNGSEQKKGPPKDQVTQYLNELFSLVQGLGGTAVVRTYIDQLAQVLSALVGWSKIVKCDGKNQKEHGTSNCNGGGGGSGTCKYLEEVDRRDRSCETCGCIKGGSSSHLGRGCTRCSGSAAECQCSPGGGKQCTADKCECAKEGKCCKCCCKEGCKEKCSCDKGSSHVSDEYNKDGYISAYVGSLRSWVDGGGFYKHQPIWSDLMKHPKRVITNDTPSQRRHQCARILLGSVCLIWSGITYMYWTGKYPNAKNSPYWNNHILDGSGLDDGTLSQWLQALGFPVTMLNNHGPQNRLDKVINETFVQKFFLGFADTSTNNGGVSDKDDNTFRNPGSLNTGGFIHAINKGAFGGIVFKGNENKVDQNKLGPLFKLYILSCAYFTGLQKNSSTQSTTPRNPKTIREILYWLSALPYSPAYKDMLNHAKDKLEKASPDNKKLSFHQEGRNYPITVEEVNLYAHFQAVTQYCPLVLIGIQGGLGKGTDSTKEPAIHSLYANTECNFTYPSVQIQAYNQVVHYIRALFYQLYFLRKQCTVKVTCGGKWRECRYGKDVVSKGVISWMCLGCDPMEHDRNYRVTELKKELGGVKEEAAGTLSRAIKKLLVPLGHVVVQLGNAQEALERGKNKDHIYKSMVIGLVGALGEVVGAVKGVVEKGSSSLSETEKEAVKKALGKVIEVVLEVVKKLEKGVNDKVKNGKAQGELTEAQKALTEAKEKLGTAKDGLDEAKTQLDKAKGKLVSLSKKDGNGSLKDMWKELGRVDDSKKSLPKFIEVSGGKLQVDAGKNTVSGFIHKVRVALEALKELAEENVKGESDAKYYYQTRIQVIIPAIKNMLDMVSSTRCVHCQDHANKCGQTPKPSVCDKCHQQYMDGTPSPLQAFLEDRLPGFSCNAVPADDTDKYPPAASHLYHSNATGQCCPLPMGFRNNFQDGVTHIGARLYGILYFFSNENMMQSCVYRLVRVTSALSATTPQVLGDVFGFFRGGVGNPVEDKEKKNGALENCKHEGDPKDSSNKKYFCGWCASGLREEVKGIGWIPKGDEKTPYRGSVGEALVAIKGDKGDSGASQQVSPSALSTLTDSNHYVSPLTGELYTAVSATFGGTYLSWVLYLSDALEGGLESLASEFLQIECRGCRDCDPNKCKKGEHGQNSGQCGCQSIVSCTGVLPVLYRHGFSYGNPFNLEGYQQKGKESGDYSIQFNGKGGKEKNPKHCHEFLESLQAVIQNKQATSQDQEHPLTKLLSEVGQLQYDIRLPWIFVLTLAWLVAVLYLAFGAIWPLDWTHMRSHWLRGGEHQWQCMWYKITP